MINSLSSAHRWLAAGLLAASAAVAQAETYFSVNTLPVAGGSFTLFLSDDAVPAGSGFSDTDLQVVFDPAVFTLTGSAAGSAFGIANIVATPYAADFYGFTITRDASVPQPATFGENLLALTFSVSLAAGGTSNVSFYPGSAPVAVPGYYNLTAAGVNVPVTPIPEPASAALLLAGIALTLSAARRRQG